ncbi:M1 family metallopeptidase [Candidatus Saccharibacteria bacterium]|nr:M1 family metallopeptidase [Candidatus Saccharibacteria bacterium]
MSKAVTRLFTQFNPKHYNLSLQIDPELMTFTGTVQISGKKTGRPSQRITMHQKGLDVTSARIVKHDKKQGEAAITVARINTQKSYDEVRLHTDEKLFPGEYDVIMDFSGKITRNMEGIYPCFFKHDGQDKKLIATQFESHHAREAFPCIDEPEAKATFDLTLTTPKTSVVLANTPVKTQEKTSKTVTTKFETTPVMSTYLLAFAFGEMGFLEAQTKDGVLVRSYATPDNVKHTEFALDVAVKCLEFYNEYFDIPYPLPKCDFIALPDFASGAMENWGCITFREQALLVDEKNTSLPMKQWVAQVVAHELTHQWFGNLVTMKWWNDLWLNESFATWMAYLAVDHLFPEWKIWEDFIVSEQSQALKLDALENTHPINVTINHPDEIRTIFDAISYEKGGSVLLMLKNYLGDEDFRDGLRVYLKRHAYQNTESTDLWAAWEEVSGKPVKEFMHDWTTLSGYPIVYAGEYEGKPSLLQERFYLNPKANKRPTTWPVPLLCEQLSLERIDKTATAVELPQDVLLNQGRTGFYRTAYAPAISQHLADRVKAGELSNLDRLGLLADSFEAAKAGYASTVDTLKLLEAYKDEDQTFVWDVIVAVLGGIRHTMRDEELREAMKPLGRELTVSLVDKLGWDIKKDESHFDTLLRPTVLASAAVSDNEMVVNEALKRFNAMAKPEDVDPDIRGVVYGTAARKGGQAEFDKLLKLHNESVNSEDRVTLSAALTGFRQAEIIKQALGQITSDNVRLQDAGYWVAYSFANRHARDVTWDWMVANWDWLQQNMGSDLSFYRMPNYAARNYSDESFIPSFQKFFESHMSAAFERPVKQAIETIQWQAAWRDRDLNAIKDYFAP